MFLVGNKNDICALEEVNEDEGMNLAEELRANFQIVSAKESTGIEELFLKIAKQFINLKLTEENEENSFNNNQYDDNIEENEENEEINYLKNINNKLDEENKHLKDEINILNNKNSELQNEIINLKKNNSDILNKLNNVNNNIIQSNQIQSENNINDELSLKKKLEMKENEIKNLKEGNDLLPIIFSSEDQKIHYSIICKKTDNFNAIENKLYEIYPKYLEYENKFYVNGNEIIKSKTISENNIKYSDIVMVISSGN